MVTLREGDRVRITGEVTDQRLRKYLDRDAAATVLRCALAGNGGRRCLVQFDQPDGMYGLYWLDAGVLGVEVA